MKRLTRHSAVRPDAPHVVIVGGGFAGVSALQELAHSGMRVTLVDRHPYNTFQPLLYQVATGGLNPGDVTFPLRTLSVKHGARYRRAEVVGLDSEHQQIICADGDRIGYDYLIIGTGITTNHFGIPGAKEITMSMYTRPEALRVRDALFGGLEKVASQQQADARSGSFTVVVSGGGPTGVEMAGQLAELKKAMLGKAFPELDPSEVRVILVEMMDSLLNGFAESLQKYTIDELSELGVDIRLGNAIEKVHPDQVDLKDGTSLRADLIVWAAGVAGDPALKEWGLPIGKGGRIEVEPDLRVRGEERVFAVGDAAVTVEKPLPQLAAPAMQMGKYVVSQILRLSQQKPTQAFHYRDPGLVAALGTRSAVVQLPIGLKLTGLIGGVAWVALHLWYLLGGRNRIQTLLNLAYRYMLWPSQTSVIVGDIVEPPSQTPEGHGARVRADSVE